MKKDWIAQAIKIMGYVLIGISIIMFLIGGLISKEYGMFTGLLFGTPFLVSGIFIMGFSRIIELLNSINEYQKKTWNKENPPKYIE